MSAANHDIQVRMLYVSHAVGPQSTTMTRSILMQAQAHNRAHNISGVLCQGQGFFLQVIEGQRSHINALYGRILADTRHKDVELLHWEETTQRLFGRWAMALVHLSVNDPMVKLHHPDFDPYAAPGPRVLQQVLDLVKSGEPIELPAP